MLALQDTTELLHLFGDPTRLRLLSLLERFELSVGELTAATQLTQSRVSTHLAKLRDAGLLIDRRVGTSTFCRVDGSSVPPAHRRLWDLLKADLRDSQLALDAVHAQELIAARAEHAQWPDRIAGEMEHHYSPGRTWEATCRAFAGLLSLGRVVDIGSGDGALSALLAPHARSVLCVDRSPQVVAAAAARLSRLRHVRCLTADMHALPLADASFDQALMLNVLTHAREPQRALCEAARVLSPGGMMVVVTLDVHEHTALTAAYGQIQPGFAPTALRQMLLEAGLRVRSCEVSSQERRSPRFKVVSAFAEKPNQKRKR